MENKQDIKNTVSSVNTYTGKVTVIVKKEGKIVKSVRIKNEGRWPLFHFFDLCLAGNFSAAKSFRPKYLMLYSMGESGEPVPDLTIHSLHNYLKSDNRVSQYKVETSAMYPQKSEGGVSESSTYDNYGEATVSYNFAMSSNYLDSTKRDKINLLALYDDRGTESSGSNSEPSAFIIIRQSDSETDEKYNKLGSLLTEAQSKLNDYTIFIEWKMQVGNSTSSTSAS